LFIENQAREAYEDLMIDDRTKNELQYWKLALENIGGINETLVMVALKSAEFLSASIDPIHSENIVQTVREQQVLILKTQTDLEELVDLVLGRLKMIKEE
jgi:hypothetical protein